MAGGAAKNFKMANGKTAGSAQRQSVGTDELLGHIPLLASR
jgi:hypothetical protein